MSSSGMVDAEVVSLPDLSGSQPNTAQKAPLLQLRDDEAIRWLDSFALKCTTNPEVVRANLAQCLAGFSEILRRKRKQMLAVLDSFTVAEGDQSVASREQVRVTASPVVSAVYQAIVNLNKLQSSAALPVVASGSSTHQMPCSGTLVVELMRLSGLQGHPCYNHLPTSITTLVDTAAISTRSVLRSAPPDIFSADRLNDEIQEHLVGCIVRLTKFTRNGPEMQLKRSVAASGGRPLSQKDTTALLQRLRRAYEEELKIILLCLEKIAVMAEPSNAQKTLPTSRRLRESYQKKIEQLIVVVQGLADVGRQPADELDTTTSALTLKRPQIYALEDFINRAAYLSRQLEEALNCSRSGELAASVSASSTGGMQESPAAPSATPPPSSSSTRGPALAAQSLLAAITPPPPQQQTPAQDSEVPLITPLRRAQSALKASANNNTSPASISVNPSAVPAVDESAAWSNDLLAELGELAVEDMLEDHLRALVSTGRTEITTQEALKVMAGVKRVCEGRCEKLSDLLANREASNYHRAVKLQHAKKQLEAIHDVSTRVAEAATPTGGHGTKSGCVAVDKKVFELEQQLAAAQQDYERLSASDIYSNHVNAVLSSTPPPS